MVEAMYPPDFSMIGLESVPTPLSHTISSINKNNGYYFYRRHQKTCIGTVEEVYMPPENIIGDADITGSCNDTIDSGNMCTYGTDLGQCVCALGGVFDTVN